MADIQDINQSLQILNINGVHFNTEERFQLEMALNQLLNNSTAADFDELLFWGRVEGVKQDYYVAVAYCYNDRYEFPEKKFYWCNAENNMTVKAFPVLHGMHREHNDNFAAKPFSGVPGLLHVKLVDPAEEAKKEEEKNLVGESNKDPLADTEEETEATVKKVNFTEIDRLLHHVLAIENDCQIIPQGSMKLTVKHEVQRNEAFNGLSSTDAFNLSNYSHFRNVQDEAKKSMLEDHDAIF